MTRVVHIQPYATGERPPEPWHIHHSKILLKSLIGVPCSVFNNPSLNLSPLVKNPSLNLSPERGETCSYSIGQSNKELKALPSQGRVGRGFFGEPFIEQRSVTEYYTPYTFSAKERDLETGYSYFGARYYSSTLSIWLSVDPMADERSWLSPYNYCQWNPLVLVDPDGMLDWHPDVDGNLIADKGDDALTLAKYLGMSFKEANAYISNMDNWDEEARQNGILLGEIEGHVLSIPDVGIRAGNIAEFHLGSEEWNTMAKRGNYGRGSFKCNAFVGEVTTAAGGSPGTPVLMNPTRSRLPFIRRRFGYPLAEQWADPAYFIPGWRVLGENETPRRGDVAAYENPNAIRASGHTAVVQVPGLTIGTSAQRGGRITRTDFGFNLRRSHNVPITFRRYDPNH